MEPLSSDYFTRPTVDVARDLLGVLLVRQVGADTRLVGRIVETEAYTQDDPACHACGLVDAATGGLRHDRRGVELFGAPGTAYVYLIYGMHWLLNVVTEPEGVAGAVLIRALEPVRGVRRMETRRPAARSDVQLTNGPGKLTQAFGVDEAFHGTDLTAPPLFFAAPDDASSFNVATTARVGISKAVDRPWRFLIADHPYVSPAVPSNRR